VHAVNHNSHEQRIDSCEMSAAGLKLAELAQAPIPVICHQQTWLGLEWGYSNRRKTSATGNGQAGNIISCNTGRPSVWVGSHELKKERPARRDRQRY
jgi:hypothetical protein